MNRLFPLTLVYTVSSHLILQYDFILPGNIKNGLGTKNNRDSSRLLKKQLKKKKKKKKNSKNTLLLKYLFGEKMRT